jgi:glycogen debranching enzyme
MGQPPLTVLDGSAFVLSDRHGDIGDASGGLDGFFWEDTRFVSRWSLTIDGAALELLSTADLDHFAAEAFLVPPSPRIFENPQLSVMRRRVVRGGWLEELLVVNHRRDPRRVVLRLDVDADFADLFEVKDGHVRARDIGRRAEGATITLDYANGSYTRQTRVTCDAAPADEQGFTIELDLAPHEIRPVTLTVTPDGRPAPAAGFEAEREGMREAVSEWLARAPALDTDWEALRHAYRRSLLDLAALRFRPWRDEPEIVPAAGLPWFMTLFGRDSLITSYQALPFVPELAPAALRALAAHQGREVADVRDEDPGKILHELRYGELTQTGELPWGPYYGSADATPLFVVVLDEAHRWSGDDALALELEPAARAALRWIDDHGDLLGDGYVRYRRRTPRGLVNQCWKDSWNAILFADGTLAEGPFACCEIQGYAYDAKVRGARLAREVWGDAELADRLQREAAELRRRFHADFWMEERGAYALALDGEGRQVDSLTSNIGHLLWSGIVDEAPAARVAAQLMGEELFSGWGLRTMGTGEGGYNPVEYHNGTVWPHDTSLIAHGLAAYGFRDEAALLCEALVEASALFGHRLPEVFAGYPRALTRFPVEYPTASSPQAWAAAAPLLLLRSVLGLEPGGEHGPRIDAHLPAAFTRIELGLPSAAR